MPILQTFICDICDLTHTESEPGAGAPAWGSFHGIVLNSAHNPVLCPEHKAELANKMDTMKGARHDVG